MSDSYDDYEARMQLAESVREARLSTLNQPNKAETFYLEKRMGKQPEALRLADQVHNGNGEWMDEAAAELRRLHYLVDKYKWQVKDTCARAEKAEAQRDGLLEALKALLKLHDSQVDTADAWNMSMEEARAAITKAEAA